MPLTSYEDLILDSKTMDNVPQECFPGSFLKEFSPDTEEIMKELETVDEMPAEDHDFAVLVANVGRGVTRNL